MSEENDIFRDYSIEQTIGFLKSRDHSQFEISKGRADLIVRDIGMLVIQAPDDIIPDAYADLAVKVMEELDTCIERAKKWLENFDLKNDKWHPDALDKGVVADGLYVGEFISYAPYPYKNKGFILNFSTVNYYPCCFAVKFHGHNLWPFAVEEYVD